MLGIFSINCMVCLHIFFLALAYMWFFTMYSILLCSEFARTSFWEISSVGIQASLEAHPQALLQNYMRC